MARLSREWSYPVWDRYKEDVEWGEGADQVDAAVTHALASAYRVGANGVPLNLLKGPGYAIKGLGYSVGMALGSILDGL